MVYFPGVFDVICRHTDLMGLSPAISRRGMAHSIELLLRDQHKNKLAYKCLKTCPVCEAEDRRLYNRTIVHVPHQMVGVNVCWKHGCPLTADGEPAIPKENDIEHHVALYAHSLYIDPIDGYIEQTAETIQAELSAKKLSFKQLIAQAIYDGYISSTGLNASYQLFFSHRIRPLGFTVRLLAYIYSDVEKLRSNFKTCQNLPKHTTQYELLDSAYNIGKYRCKKCKRTFYRHEYAMSSGLPCPHCGTE